MVFNQEELQVGGYVNYQSGTLGIDSYEHCFSKLSYRKYPYSVSYKFNELGYRERSVNDYNPNAIIAIGDSFTVGLGLPVELTYPVQLESLVNHQVLNFGLNGASNDWISRKLPVLLKYFDPMAIIVHYTFSHRRERNEPTWFDDERTICDPLPNNEENYTNWLTAHESIQRTVGNIPTIYSHIPKWHPDKSGVAQLDYARDNFHYGPITCANLAREYADYITQQ